MAEVEGLKVKDVEKDLEKLKKEESVEPLIDFLGRAEKNARRRKARGYGRLYYDARGVLKAITERDFQGAADWKNYWKALKAGKIRKPKNGFSNCSTSRLSFQLRCLTGAQS